MIAMVQCTLRVNGPDGIKESWALFTRMPPPGRVLTLKKWGKAEREIRVASLCLDEEGLVMTADAISSPSD